MRAVLLIMALVLVSAGVSAQQGGTIWASGNFMKNSCHSETGRNLGRCEGFAMAVAGVMAVAPVAGWRACIPEGVLVSQLITIMLKYLDDHPERLHHDAVDLAAQGFAEAFPCPQ